jgi:hypothetical protein
MILDNARIHHAKHIQPFHLEHKQTRLPSTVLNCICSWIRKNELPMVLKVTLAYVSYGNEGP